MGEPTDETQEDVAYKAWAKAYQHITQNTVDMDDKTRALLWLSEIAVSEVNAHMRVLTELMPLRGVQSKP